MTSRNSPCTCGSGKRFKHCCGIDNPLPTLTHSRTPVSVDYTDSGWFAPHLRGEGMAAFCPPAMGKDLVQNVAAPPGVLIVPNFLNSTVCTEWCNYFRSARGAPLEVQNIESFENTSEIAWERHASRITQAVDYSEKKDEVLKEISRAFSECVMPYFNTQFAAFEQPTVLRYEPGGKYGAHSDNEYWDREAGHWRKTLNRDFSILLYLNDQYEGGKLSFPNFLCKVKPTTGMLISFPSDHRYLHAAEPLLSGERFAVVSWGAITKQES